MIFPSESLSEQVDCNVEATRNATSEGCERVLDLSDPQKYLALALPTPEEIEVGFYHAPAEYYELLLLRDRLIDYALRNDLPFVGSDDPSVFDTDGSYVYS